MPLPNAEDAFVPSRKLTHYLLDDTHSRGESKARYLRSHGFSVARADLLEAALLSIAATGTVIEVEATDHGSMYVVIGGTIAPTGRIIRLRTVWIIEYSGARPRFVTAYPAR